MKILIVDDREENLYLLQTLLKGNGYDVVSARNGVDALSKLQKESVDMIISDILMPEMDGFQLCRECKRDDSLKKIPFMFYTATYTDKKDEEFALSLGVEKFIIKPQEPEVFLNILNEVIEEQKKGIPVTTSRELIAEDEAYLVEYNKRLIQKLEKKVVDLERANKLIRHLYGVLEAIRNVNQLIVKEKTLNILLQKTCDTLIKARGYHAAWLGFLKDEKTFITVVGSPLEEAVFHFCEKVMSGDYPPCIKKAFTRKELYRIVDRVIDCKDCSLKYEHGERQSAIMRIEYKHKFFGLLFIMLIPENQINKEEEGLLKNLANDIAFGLHNIELEERDKLSEQKLQESYKRLRKTMEDTIYAIGKITEIRDPYTSGHQKNVSQVATFIAQKMKLSQDKIEGIRIASLVHDIGKIGLPAEILNKPSKLTNIEYSLIKSHSQIGYDILKSIDFPYPIAQIVLQHHEKLNGSGYPQGLKGEDILLEAKVLGIADVLEAMSSHRPYRAALGINEALEEISRNKGTLYDSEAVNICLKLFKKKEVKFNRIRERLF